MASPLILFFSRGRGYGHAITDLELDRRLAELGAGFTIRYFSYGTGAGVFRARGVEVCDLQLADEASPLAVGLRASVEIARHRPQVIVAHEDVFVPVAAKMHGIPCIYVSTWLPQPASLAWDAVDCADSLLVIEDGGLFPFPPSCAHKLQHSGPVVRAMKHGPKDRARLRSLLGLSAESVVWLVIPGGWANESRAPVARSMLAAFRQLQQTHADAHLLWLGEVKEPALLDEFARISNVRVLTFCDDSEKYMIASDVIFTKGTHGVTLEAAQLGVPSISISYRANPIDEILVPRVANNTHLHALAITPDMLLQEATKARSRGSVAARDYTEGGAKAARILHDEIIRLVPKIHTFPVGAESAAEIASAV